uniref:Uncharacterized protein n=1 Tax=Romanomermis culicivorax TaxID=13658 RepID=A0A915JC30_ROMCU
MQERPSRSTSRKENDDYDSQKYQHGEYASNERPKKYHSDRYYSMYQRERLSDSEDRQKKIEWASTLKRDQLQKEELESQQPTRADSEKMMDELTTSQQAQVARVQQQQQGTI